MTNHYLKIYLWVLTFLFIHFTSLSAKNIDSLWNIWNDTSIHDTIRLNTHMEVIQFGYAFSNPDSALILLEENLQFAKEIDHLFSQGVALQGFGNIYYFQGAYQKAIDAYTQSNEMFQDVSPSALIGNNSNIARCYNDLGRINEAIQILNESHEYAEKNGLINFLITAKSSLAGFHLEQGAIQLAMDYIKDAIKLAEEYDNPDKLRLYFALGGIEKEANNLDEATRIFTKCLNMSKASSNKNMEAFSYSNLGNVYEVKQQYPEAEEAFKKGLALIEELGYNQGLLVIMFEVIEFYFNQNKIDETESYLKKYISIASATNSKIQLNKGYLYQGRLLVKKEQYRSALDNCQKAYAFTKENGLKAEFRDACECIYLAQKGLGNSDAALSALEENVIIRDTLFNKEQAQSYATLTAEYQFEKEKEVTDATYQANLERQSLIQKGMGIGLALLGLLAFFIFRGYKNKQKANQLLASKNQEIEVQKEQLEQVNQTKDRIFAIIGHDMRKPSIAFRGIARKVNYLLEKKDFALLQKLGESIEKDALELNNLTDNLLNWALTQKNILPHQPTQIELPHIIEEVFMTLGRSAKDKGIHLKSEISQDTLIMADRNALLTIIRNLVDNAIKFTPKNGEVIIASNPSDVGVDIFIKDTGVGMDAEKTKSIFLLQEGKSTQGTLGEKGTGLGLHLVYELVKLNNGDITVTSKKGQGTEFRISLKAA